MKSTLALIALITSLSSIACVGEGQLWPTKVVKIVKTESSCRAFIGGARIDDHPECSLDAGALMNGGIEVGLNKDGSCRSDVGHEISGVLVNRHGHVKLAN